MKKILFILTMCVFSIQAFGLDFDDINIPEPEFTGEVYIITDATNYIPLQIEHAKLRTTANWGAAMIGIAKGSSYWEIKGCNSPTTLSEQQYSSDLFILVSYTSNNIDPRRVLQIIPLEIQKNRRICNIAGYDTFSGASADDIKTTEFQAKKYGEHSYLIKISAAELSKIRDNNSKEFNKFGKQYIIQLEGVKTNECFTFGIAAKSKKK